VTFTLWSKKVKIFFFLDKKVKKSYSWKNVTIVVC